MSSLYTIGHSTRTFEEFLEILQAFDISQVIDVRTIPKSRRMPWFNKTELANSLQQVEITYQHFPELGGLRHPQKDSINLGWHHPAFRGFADYMQSAKFYEGFKHLSQTIKESTTAVMCAEVLPWRCHRSLIADAAVVRHIKVIHILNKTSFKIHDLTAFAVVERDKKPIKIYYPKPQSTRLIF